AAGEGRKQDVTELEMARRALGRLRTLMTDILDVARIDAGLFQGRLEPVDLAALVTETAQTVGGIAHPVEVRVRATGKLVVSAEAGRLRQCLENILVNAIQKSPKDAAVDVLVTSETRESGEWALVE